MKLFAIIRTGIIASLLAIVVGCAPKSEPVGNIYRFEGIEPAVYYTAVSPLSEGFDGETVAIVIQGWHGGVKVHKGYIAMQSTLKDAYVVAPMFPRAESMKKNGVELDGRAIWNNSWPLDLTIPGTADDDWRGGGDAEGTELSSYEIIDLLLAKLSDKTLFPNLRKVALIGFSAGGQFVGRYVAVGKGEVAPHIEMRYVALAPSTFLIPEPNDSWHYGLKGRPRYSRNLSEEQIMENLRSRRCLHGCGLLDTLERDLDMTPLAMKQGHNRYVRFENFKELVRKDPRWSEVTTFHTFEDIGHQAQKAYEDPFFVEYVMGK